MSHCVARLAAEIDPAGHFLHAAAPMMLLNDPAAQLAHALTLFDPVLPLNLPTAQPVQSSKPAEDQVTATQTSQ